MLAIMVKTYMLCSVLCFKLYVMSNKDLFLKFSCFSFPIFVIRLCRAEETCMEAYVYFRVCGLD